MMLLEASTGRSSLIEALSSRIFQGVMENPSRVYSFGKKRRILFVMLCLSAWGDCAIAEDSVKSFRLLNTSVSAPETKFSDGNKKVSLDSFRGRTVILNFWATWCSPCLKEMPSLERLSTKLAKDNLVVVAVSQDDGGQAQVKPFLEKLKLKAMVVLYDYDKKAFRDFAIRGLPTSFVISPEGKILARVEGSIEWDEQAVINKINGLRSWSK